MLTIKAEVQRDKQRSDGTYNVKVRFTQDRKVKRLSSSLFVTSKDLTKSFNFKEGTTVKKYSLNLVNEVFEPELDDYYHYYHLVHEERCV